MLCQPSTDYDIQIKAQSDIHQHLGKTGQIFFPLLPGPFLPGVQFLEKTFQASAGSIKEIVKFAVSASTAFGAAETLSAIKTECHMVRGRSSPTVPLRDAVILNHRADHTVTNRDEIYRTLDIVFFPSAPHGLKSGRISSMFDINGIIKMLFNAG